MKIAMASGGIAATNAYLITDESSGQCVIFDAPDHTVQPLIDEIRKQGWTPIGLWLTHGHFDHVADHQVVRDAFPDIKILIHKLDEPKLLNPSTRFFQLPFAIPAGHADGYLSDGEQLQIGALNCRVIHTPGHSPGHVCFYFENDGLLIGGDLIIGGAIGRYDLPDSNFDDLQASVIKVMKLPDPTQLLPGHGQPSSLGEERRDNSFVQQILGSV